MKIVSYFDIRISNLVAARGRARILSGTFGNIETNEDWFLQGLASSMEKDDVAILDVSIATLLYNKQSEPYCKIDTYSYGIEITIHQG